MHSKNKLILRDVSYLVEGDTFELLILINDSTVTYHIEALTLNDRIRLLDKKLYRDIIFVDEPEKVSK
jgi:hypothetical protein